MLTNPLQTSSTRACLIQDKLGITKNSLAFDINQGCSGFVYSLSLASSLINNDMAERILIICSDHYLNTYQEMTAHVGQYSAMLQQLQ